VTFLIPFLEVEVEVEVDVEVDVSGMVLFIVSTMGCLDDS
jgi:hypothetical protein